MVSTSVLVVSAISYLEYRYWHLQIFRTAGSYQSATDTNTLLFYLYLMEE